MSAYRSKHTNDPETAYQPAHGAERNPEPARSQKATPRPSSLRAKVLLILGIVFLVAALIIAGMLVFKYLGARAHYDDIVQAASGDLPTSGQMVPDDTEPAAITIDWDTLKAINPDIVGWLLIPGTHINYPIVQAQDNSYYLDHRFDGEYSAGGSIFLDMDSSSELNSRNNLIYGHNMLDGSMFSDLSLFTEQEFFDAHRRILILTPTRSYTLELEACVVCDADDTVRKLEFADRVDFESYLSMLLGYAVIVDADGVLGIENLYCFATCTDFNNTKRTILLAKLVETKEST